MDQTATGKLAIAGGAQTHSGGWPKWPVFDLMEEAAVLRVLRSGQWWSVGGTEVVTFEREFADFQHASHAVCVTNGTAALEVSLRALGIGCGDEVIVPPYTFVATASSVLQVSATPVFADICPHNLNLDPDAVEAAITPGTAAIIPVHIAGCPADMDRLRAIAQRHHLALIEDAAQAHGAEWKGRKVGAIGEMGTFSFQASKNLNAGEGGAILTDQEELAERCWSVHNVGRVRSGKWYEHQVLGGNFRMTEFQAAILRSQIKRLPEQMQQRTRGAAVLNQSLSEIPGIQPLIPEPAVTAHAYHLYLFRYISEAFGGHSRDEFVDALSMEGVPCSAGYVPLYREKLFYRKANGQGKWCAAGRPVDYTAVQCPVTEAACREIVWLSQNLLLADESSLSDVAAAIHKIQRAWTR